VNAEVINHAVTRVWLLLAGLTGVSWWLGAALDLRYATVTLLILAFFKVRLVIMYFMEVRAAPIALRLIFETWVVVVCAAVITIYLVGAPGP
jgi:hypothetical protein